jgi:histidinol-phosphate aminotransferase
MLPFIRSDLTQLMAYKPHPGGAAGSPAQQDILLDRLDTNECPYDLPEDLKQKLSWSVQQELESNRYPDGGHARLKEAIAHYVIDSSSGTSDPNPFITPDCISVGNGSDELIRSLLIATCLGEGGILVAQPTFSMYGILAQTLGIPVVTIARSPQTFEIDLKAAAAAIATHSTLRAVFVVHPNSPTGNALTPSELDWLRSLPDSILVVIDEAYFEFSGKTVVPELPSHPNWVILRTFSKAFRLAAHRVGYAIAHPELTTILDKVRLPYNLPSVSQVAALVALTHAPELFAVLPEMLEQRQEMIRVLSAQSRFQVWPSDANFVFLQFQSAANATAIASDPTVALDHLFQRLRTQGTLVRKISNGLRITVGTPAENQRTLERLLR